MSIFTQEIDSRDSLVSLNLNNSLDEAQLQQESEKKKRNLPTDWAVCKFEELSSL